MIDIFSLNVYSTKSHTNLTDPIKSNGEIKPHLRPLPPLPLFLCFLQPLSE